MLFLEEVKDPRPGVVLIDLMRTFSSAEWTGNSSFFFLFGEAPALEREMAALLEPKDDL